MVIEEEMKEEMKEDVDPHSGADDGECEVPLEQKRLPQSPHRRSASGRVRSGSNGVRSEGSLKDELSAGHLRQGPLRAMKEGTKPGSVGWAQTGDPCETRFLFKPSCTGNLVQRA